MKITVYGTQQGTLLIKYDVSWYLVIFYLWMYNPITVLAIDDEFCGELYLVVLIFVCKDGSVTGLAGAGFSATDAEDN